MVFLFKMGDEEMVQEGDAGENPAEPPAEEKPEPAVKKPRRKGKARRTGGKKTVKRTAEKADEKPTDTVKEERSKPQQDNVKLIAGAAVVLVVLAALIYLTQKDKGYNAPVTTPTTTPTAENANIAEKDDIVTLDYTGRLLNGTVFDTSIREVADKNGIYNPLRTYEPITFTLGYGGLIKGFEEAVQGMRIGEQKEFTLPPEKAYGYRREDLIQPVERRQSSPIVQNISLDKFVEDIGRQPYDGMEFTVPNRTGYEVTWPMSVIKVYNDTVTFRYHPDRNATVETVFGPANVYSTEDEIVIEVDAEVGDKILTLAGPAKVVDINDENITMDFNHQLAGQTLKFNVKLLGITKQ